MIHGILAHRFQNPLQLRMALKQVAVGQLIGVKMAFFCFGRVLGPIALTLSPCYLEGDKIFDKKEQAENVCFVFTL